MRGFQLIRAIGRQPAHRNTLYQIDKRYDDHDPPDIPSFVPRAPQQLLKPTLSYG